MYTVSLSRRFERSFRKLQRSGRLKSAVSTDFKRVVTSLQKGEKLSAVYKDHALTGDMLGYRECHISSDLLLVYERRDEVLVLLLIDIGSHSQIFG